MERSDPIMLKKTTKNDSIYLEYKSVNIEMPNNIRLNDRVSARFELWEDTKFDWASIVVGYFDQDSVSQYRTDTIQVVNGEASFEFIANKSGVFFLRGELIGINKKTYSNSDLVEETLADFRAFEEKIEVH